METSNFNLVFVQPGAKVNTVYLNAESVLDCYLGEKGIEDTAGEWKRKDRYIQG